MTNKTTTTTTTTRSALDRVRQALTERVGVLTDTSRPEGPAFLAAAAGTEIAKATGIGALVDADMEEASARLQALQTQQQLGIQSLSIANTNSENILQLFRQ